MSAPIMRHAPATILPERKSSGAHYRWKIPDSLRIAVHDHPITPVRFVQMRKVAAEIADKQRRGLPLVPELNIIGNRRRTSDIQAENIH